jgi:hypothetical protein
MQVTHAQREIRRAYRGGFAGQLVSGVLWAVSAGLATWVSTRSAIFALVVGGILIFPLTTVLLRLMPGTPTVSPANPLSGLGAQIAFTLPLGLPVVGAAALYRLNWFYPAFMILLGAHYLPFVFLYGMRMFAALTAVLVGAGLLIGLYADDSFVTGGWVTAVVLLVFAALGGRQVAREDRRPV